MHSAMRGNVVKALDIVLSNRMRGGFGIAAGNFVGSGQTSSTICRFRKATSPNDTGSGVVGPRQT